MNRLRILGFLFMCSLVFAVRAVPARGQGADASMPLDEYWEKLQQTQALVAALLDAPLQEGRPQLLAAADEWERVSGVVLPDGSQVPLDHSFLVAHLRSDPPDLARLKELLAALLAAGQNRPHTPFTAQDAQPLADILARPEFQWRPQEPSLLETLLRRLGDYLREFLRRLLPGGVHINLSVDLLNYALTGVVLVALALVLFFSSRNLLAGLVSEGRVPSEAGSDDEALTANLALKRAQALANTGDYRAAVRHLYLSSLLLLEERRLLRYDRSRTNREYLRSLTHVPHLALLLTDVIEVFDRVWYGYQPLDEAAYERYAARIADLNQQAKP
jgi:hypothetical protein